MGGYGSGRPRQKTPVEECRVISANLLARDKFLRDRRYTGGTMTWTRTATGEKVSSIGFKVNTLDRADAWIRLYYTLTRSGEDLDYRVGLTTTPLPRGGVRWWFVCPLTANGRACRRRCGKLYLPPGGRYFGCRLCYNLTYQSAQDAHKSDGLYAMLAAQFGVHPRAIKYALEKM